MYNNTIEDIKKSINVTHARYSNQVDTFDFTIEVGENTFKFEEVNDTTCDLLLMNGDDISTENLTDMYFKIDGKMMSLLDIMNACGKDAYLEAEEWMACDKVDIRDEEQYRHDVQSLYRGA